MSKDYSTTSSMTLNIQYHTMQGTFVPTVDARELHGCLGVATQFTVWITRRIEEYGFLREIDFLFYPKMDKTPGRQEHVYQLTLDMAKELCMVERTAKGREARHYFIACEKALMQHGGAIAAHLEMIEQRLTRLEAPQASTPDHLTAQGQLPPPAPRIREHAEVSWHLAAVWALVRDSNEVLSNHEIAQRTGIARRTARAHTRYLLGLGLADLHETFPRHLYQLAEQAERRNPGCYQRLNKLTTLIQARQAF